MRRMYVQNTDPECDEYKESKQLTGLFRVLDEKLSKKPFYINKYSGTIMTVMHCKSLRKINYKMSNKHHSSYQDWLLDPERHESYQWWIRNNTQKRFDINSNFVSWKLPLFEETIYQYAEDSEFGYIKTGTTRINPDVRRGKDISFQKVERIDPGDSFYIDSIFNKYLNEMVGRTVGIPGVTYEIKLYKLNIMSGGDMFALHRDHSKPGMIATIVVYLGGLPRQFKFIIDGEEMVWDESEGNIAIFTPDVPHTIQPLPFVGMRYTLTFEVFAPEINLETKETLKDVPRLTEDEQSLVTKMSQIINFKKNLSIILQREYTVRSLLDRSNLSRNLTGGDKLLYDLMKKLGFKIYCIPVKVTNQTKYSSDGDSSGDSSGDSQDDDYIEIKQDDRTCLAKMVKYRTMEGRFVNLDKIDYSLYVECIGETKMRHVMGLHESEIKLIKEVYTRNQTSPLYYAGGLGTYLETIKKKKCLHRQSIYGESM